MFLELAHTKLDVFSISQELALECYRITRQFPPDEKFGLVQQIRRAAVSVHLNLAEGSSRKSLTERQRFYEIARGSVIEIDTAIGLIKLSKSILEAGTCNLKSSSLSSSNFVVLSMHIFPAYNLSYLSLDHLQNLGEAIIKTFKLLTGMIK